MNSGKLLVGGIGLCLLVVIASYTFIALIPDPEPVRELKVPGEQPLRQASTSAPGVPPPLPPGSTPPLNAPANSDTPDEHLLAISREVEVLRDRLTEMAASQVRMEALVHNLARYIETSVPKIPTQEQSIASVNTLFNVVKEQRQTVEKARRDAVQVARSFGLPESAIDGEITDVVPLPPGRDYSALNRARATLFRAKESLNASELELSNKRMAINGDAPGLP